jgi:peptidoglycan/LPS O-acetylase OafA/YrhL
MATDHFVILILTSALGTGILINIFLFKMRKIQMRIIIISILLECLIIFLYIKQTNNYSTGNYSLWSALHVLIIIFLIFAAKGIYKDAKIIKDSNRLR